MPETAPALVTVAATGLPAWADHVPPVGEKPARLAVVAGAQMAASFTSGLALRVTDTVSEQVCPPNVTLYMNL